MDSHLCRAIKKYGPENFVFEVIYQSKEKEHTLLEMEAYFINYYNTMKAGYNMSIGGKGRPHKPNKRQRTKRSIRVIPELSIPVIPPTANFKEEMAKIIMAR